MLDIVFRVYGEQFDVDMFFERNEAIVASDTYKKGDHDMLGNPSEFSGFDAIIAENGSREQCLQKVQQFLELNQQALSFLKANSVHCVMDIDATVKVTDEMPTAFNMPPCLLGELSGFNIAVEFSAYPHVEGM